MSSIGLPQYRAAFQSNIVSGSILLKLTDERLRVDFDITNSTQREALLELIAQLRRSANEGAAEPQSAQVASQRQKPSEGAKDAAAPALDRGASSGSAKSAPGAAQLQTAQEVAAKWQELPEDTKDAFASVLDRGTSSGAAESAPLDVASSVVGDSLDVGLRVVMEVVDIAAGLPFAQPLAQAVKIILTAVQDVRVNRGACRALGYQFHPWLS